MSFSQLLKDIFSPDICCICGEVKKGFFDREKIIFHGTKRPIESPFCRHCTKRMERSFVEKRKKIAGVNCFAVYLFDFSDESVSNAIYHLKTQNCAACRSFFAAVASEVMTEQIPEIENCYISYVPRSIKLYNKYSFDQAKEVVRTIVRVNKQVHFKGFFYRDKRYTLPQKNLSAKERYYNAKMSLKLKNTPHHSDRIVVLDDIVTTGATANAISSLLINSGVSNVYFLFIAGVEKFKERS